MFVFRRPHICPLCSDVPVGKIDPRLRLEIARTTLGFSEPSFVGSANKSKSVLGFEAAEKKGTEGNKTDIHEAHTDGHETDSSTSSDSDTESNHNSESYLDF